MIDALTRLLLLRHAPNDPRLQEAPVVKSNARKMIMVMDSTIHSSAEITKAISAFNLANKDQMSYSYELPITMNGIAQGSWVMLVEGD